MPGRPASGRPRSSSRSSTRIRGAASVTAIDLDDPARWDWPPEARLRLDRDADRLAYLAEYKKDAAGFALAYPSWMADLGGIVVVVLVLVVQVLRSGSPLPAVTDQVDVVVTDGFTGNVALKTLEGGMKSLVSALFGVFGYTLAAQDVDKTREVAGKYGIGHVTTELSDSLSRDDVDARRSVYFGESLGSGVRYSEEVGFFLLEDGVWRKDERQSVRTHAQSVADLVRNLAREATSAVPGPAPPLDLSVLGAVAAAVASIALPTGVAVTAALNDNGTDNPGYVASPTPRPAGAVAATMAVAAVATRSPCGSMTPSAFPGARWRSCC